MKTFTSIVLIFCLGGPLIAQESMVYKYVDSIELTMEIYKPHNFDSSKKYPAMLFYFGGGWKGGNIHQFLPQATHFTKRGVICFLVDYRVSSRHKTSPFESLKDAKSAMRFIRKNSDKLNIDKDKIVASGGSAGGHLAAALAFTTEYNEPTDDKNISTIPNALVLFNPVVDNGPGGYGYERIKEKYTSFSPAHTISKNAPPTIFFLGSDDSLIPVKTAELFKENMEKNGNRCDLHIYDGQKHGFFNYRNFQYYKKTVYEADKFLQSLGFLSKKENLKIE